MYFNIHTHLIVAVERASNSLIVPLLQMWILSSLKMSLFNVYVYGKNIKRFLPKCRICRLDEISAELAI